MKPSVIRNIRRAGRWGVGAGVLATLAAAILLQDRWWPSARHWVRETIAARKVASSVSDHDHAAAGAESADEHAGHDHAAHDATESLELSPQAMQNIGLTRESLQPLQPENFVRTVSFPGIVTERPGRTRIEVSTPMAGLITHVHAVQGESVKSGSLLFELRITAEELVKSQTELLKTVGDLDVEDREIARLQGAGQSGAVSPKSLLEHQYARDRLQVLLSAHREALRLQGLSEVQIDQIVTDRRLLRDLRIMAPNPDSHQHDEIQLSGDMFIPVSRARDEQNSDVAAETVQASGPLILQQVLIHKGETVRAGTTLAVMADMSELYIEGRAFEQDADLLTRAAEAGWRVLAEFDRAGGRSQTVPDLDLLYSANTVDSESRTLRFFVSLPNHLVRESPSPNGQRFSEWEYRPGQRLQVRVPVEEWEHQFVVPAEAVVIEGADAFVFRQNGRRFDRVPVHIAYRDRSHVVIAGDGSVFPGDVIAMRGAYQMQITLKIRAGGGVDPHAGHHH